MTTRNNVTVQEHVLIRDKRLWQTCLANTYNSGLQQRFALCLHYLSCAEGEFQMCLLLQCKYKENEIVGSRIHRCLWIMLNILFSPQKTPNKGTGHKISLVHQYNINKTVGVISECTNLSLILLHFPLVNCYKTRLKYKHQYECQERFCLLLP